MIIEAKFIPKPIRENMFRKIYRCKDIVIGLSGLALFSFHVSLMPVWCLHMRG